MRRLALLLEYDGEGFAGSQLQRNGPTIQAELERAIEAMTGAFTRVAFAGRTDAGVHALRQVVAFDTRAPYATAAFVGGLNARLPLAIAVRAAREMEAGFDPRRQAVARRYRYTIVNAAVRAPLRRRDAWQVKGALDLQAMRVAARSLLGEHDFAAFAPPLPPGMRTRREVRAVRLRCGGRTLQLEIEATAFLMHQVRRTAAALVQVGSGHLTPAAFEQRLQQARPGAFAAMAPPQGLCLIDVIYAPPIFAEECE